MDGNEISDCKLRFPQQTNLPLILESIRQMDAMKNRLSRIQLNDWLRELLKKHVFDGTRLLVIIASIVAGTPGQCAVERMSLVIGSRHTDFVRISEMHIDFGATRDHMLRMLCKGFYRRLDSLRRIIVVIIHNNNNIAASPLLQNVQLRTHRLLGRMNVFYARNACKEMADWLAIIKHNPLHQLFRMRLGHVTLDEVWNEAGAIACCGEYGDEGHACFCLTAKVNFALINLKLATPTTCKNARLYCCGEW